MSLGDKLRLLRAERNGVTPAEIEAALPELPKGLYRYMEQRYRAVGDDNTIRMLAGYFGVPFEELRWRLEWPRKGLNRALFHAQSQGHPLTLELSTGDKVTGSIKWWDLGAAEIETEAGSLVVQRHAIERWDPIAPEPEGVEEPDEDEE
jgi:hypothetical protein